MIKSPLRYPGGKSKALKQILPLIPDFQEYREPFIGGGSVFLALKQLYPEREFWINDLYFELYTFWDCAKNNLATVENQVLEWKKQYQNGKELYKFLLAKMPEFEPIQRAAAFFVFNRITFSGTTEAGGYSEQAFQKRFTDSSVTRLVELEKLLNGVKISNLDYQKLVEEKGENVFVFLDPPYFAATKSALYGKNGQLHKIFDHQRFAETMKNCPHRWLITYDNSEYVRELFSFANILEWDLVYGMRNQTETSNQLGKEIFIANFELEKP